MSFKSRSGQHVVRAMSTALAVALVLLLTPCCEVFASLTVADVPAHNDTPHNHHDDGNAPPSGDHCAPWVEQAFIPATDVALLSPGPSSMDAPLPYQLPSMQYPHINRVVPHAGAPPPTRAVYLLTSRFLL